MDELTKTLITVGASLMGGGAMGSIVTQIVTARRAQPLRVSYQTSIYAVLKPKPTQVKLHAKVVVEHDSKPFTFDNLFVAHIKLANRGPVDLKEFPFGITLPVGEYSVDAIYAEGDGANRHHAVDVTSKVSPDGPKNAADFTLRPFNRGDSYAVRVYMVVRTNDGRDPNPQDVLISSSVSATFVEASTIGVSIYEAASLASLSIAFGPIRISVPR